MSVELPQQCLQFDRKQPYGIRTHVSPSATGHPKPLDERCYSFSVSLAGQPSRIAGRLTTLRYFSRHRLKCVPGGAGLIIKAGAFAAHVAPAAVVRSSSRGTSFLGLRLRAPTRLGATQGGSEFYKAGTTPHRLASRLKSELLARYSKFPGEAGGDPAGDGQVISGSRPLRA